MTHQHADKQADGHANDVRGRPERYSHQSTVRLFNINALPTVYSKSCQQLDGLAMDIRGSRKLRGWRGCEVTCTPRVSFGPVPLA
jgi:hypothetical protein